MRNTTKLRWFKRVPAVKEVGYDYQYRDNISSGSVESCIRELAGRLYRRVKDDLPIHDALNEEIASYAGDYPPKKLGE